jgi:hypothetical protein
MSLGKPFRSLTSSRIALAVVLALAGCSTGGSGSSNSIGTAVQNLTLDPDGIVTVITFASTKGLANALAADFEADGGQTAQSIRRSPFPSKPTNRNVSPKRRSGWASNTSSLPPLRATIWPTAVPPSLPK